MRSSYLVSLAGLLGAVCLANGQSIPSPMEGSAPLPKPSPIPSSLLAPTSDPVPVGTDAPQNGEPANSSWFSAEYLLLWFKRAPLGTPLVTTDSTNGAGASAGGLGDPKSIVLIGGTGIGFDPTSAGRIQGGWGLSDNIAIEAGGLYTGKLTKDLLVSSAASGTPFLFRPFINADTGNPNAGSFVALPGSIAGAVAVNQTSELWGADVRLDGMLIRTDLDRLDGFVGVRYLDLYEKLDIFDSEANLKAIGTFDGKKMAAGDRLLIQDTFHTRNQFGGGEIGLRGETRIARLVFTGTAQVAVGEVYQTVTVLGASTLTTVTGGTASLPGGILAAPSNNGHLTHGEFAMIPETNLQIGYDVTEQLRLSVGYELLYWTHVVRPGDQVDPIISAAQLPTSPTFGTRNVIVPPLLQNKTDFWVQGISFRVAFRY